MTAVALAGYSIGLTGYAAIKILSPAFLRVERRENTDDDRHRVDRVNFIGSYFFANGFRTTGDTRNTHVTATLARDGDLDRGAGNFFALALIMRKRIKPTERDAS